MAMLSDRRRGGRRRRRSRFLRPLAERLEQRLMLATVDWDAGGDGTRWSDPLNWSGDSLPTSGDQVRILRPAEILLDAAATVDTVQLGHADRCMSTQLTLRDAALTVTGDPMLVGVCTQLVLANGNLQGGLTNKGVVRAQGSSRVAGPILQHSTLHVEATDELGDAQLTVESELKNFQSIDLSNSGDEPHAVTLKVLNGQLINYEFLEIDSTSGLTATIDASMVSHGFLSIDEDTTITGDLTNDEFMQIGSLAKVQVLGAFTQSSNGFSEFEIAGTEPGNGFPQLNIGGSATFRGHLALRDDHGAPPANGQLLDLITFADRNGAFLDVQSELEDELVYDVSFTDTAVRLQAPVLSDLVPRSISAPDVLRPGELTTISWEVQNAGPRGRSLDNWRDRLYLSHDQELNSGDVSVGADRFVDLPLPEQGTYTLQSEVTVPTGFLGEVFLLLRTDDSEDYFESNESNNVLVRPVTITPPDVDLQITATAPNSAVAGETIQISWTVTNSGSTATSVGDWIDQVFLASEASLQSRLRVLRHEFVRSTGDSAPLPLEAGESYTVTADVVVSSSTHGPLFLGLHADSFGRQPETNEENNLFFLPINLVPPDLELTSLEVPETVLAGDTVTVKWTVRNAGDHPVSGAWLDRIMFSADEQADLSQDRFLFQRVAPPIQPLPPGESYSFEEQFVFSSAVAPGDGFIVLHANALNHVPESSHDNNVLARPVRVAAPDLHLIAATVPESAEPGGSLTVSWTVRNDSDLPVLTDSSFDAIFLSADAHLDPGDARIITHNVSQHFPLPPGAEYTAERLVQISTTQAPGALFLLVATDAGSSRGETDEENNYLAFPLRIDSPDLNVTALQAPQTVVVGSDALVSWTVANSGAGAARGNWSDVVVISRDDELDPADPVPKVVSASGFAPLASGSEYTLNQTVNFPSDAPLGDAFVIVGTDRDNRQGEENEANNTRVVPLTLVGGDLAPLTFDAPDSATLSDIVNFSWTAENRGDHPARGFWSDAVYLSDDEFLDGADHRLRSSSGSAVAPGGNYSSSRSYFLDSFDGVTPGQKFFILAVDDGHRLSETNESNNLMIRPVTIHAPDLEVTGAEVPAAINVGDEVTFSWTVTNQGNVSTTTTWRDELYLSPDEHLSSADVQVASRFIRDPHTPVAAGANYTVSETVRISEYLETAAFLLIVADRREDQGETNEENNVRAVPISLTAPDLVVVGSSSPESAVVGSEVELTWTVRNEGDGAATLSSGWTDRVRLGPESSQCPTCGTVLVSAGTADEVPLAPGEQYTLTRTVTLPHVGHPGPYKLFFIADDSSSQSESDESNFREVPIELLPDDVDLAVSDGAVAGSAVAGEPMTISWTVTNSGSAAATNTWRDRVYVSNDQVLDNSDTQLGNRSSSSHVPLAGGAQYQQSLDVTIPGSVTPGAKHLLIVTDKDQEQAETDETNNMLVLPFELLAPNLRVTQAITPETAALGDTIEVTYTVENAGEVGAAADWVDRIYLSSDEHFHQFDQQVASVNTGAIARPLAAGASYTLTQQITLSGGTTSPRFLLFVTDANQGQSETDESDNVRAVPINLTVADLKITEATAPASAVSGQQIEVSWTVTNQGQGTAFADWTDRIYISANPNFDGTLVRSESISAQTPLPPGESYTVTRTIVVPQLTAGTHFLRITTDYGAFRFPSSQPESDNSNNTFVLPIDISLADLEVTAASAPNTAAVGETISVSWTVENIGGSEATRTWRDAIFVSSDNVLDASDTPVASFPVPPTSPMAGGSTYVETQNVTIPSTAAGDRFLLFVADRFDQQAETDEENNVFSVPISLRPSDLAVTSVTVPESGLTRDTITVSYTVRNEADAVLQSDWQDRIYLSSDAAFGQGDIPLRTVSISEQTPLQSGGSYQIETTVTLPAVDAGSYFILVEGNANKAQPESNHENNVFAAPLQVLAPNLVPLSVEAPSSAQVSETISLTYTVQNQSQLAALADWHDRVFLSSDDSLDANDHLLKVVDAAPVSPLAGGEQYSRTASVQLPGDLFGNLFLLVQANGFQTQGESDRGDNVLAAQITVAEPPNLVATGFVVPETAASSGTITVRYTVTNAGQTTAVADWNDVIRFAQSKDQVSPPVLAVREVTEPTPLAAGAGYQGEVQVTLPHEAGEFFLVLQVNHQRQQGESDFADNRLERPIRLLAPDLLAESITAPGEAALGQSTTISYSVENPSDVDAAGQWHDRLYLSQDNQLDDEDVPVATFNAAQTLPAGTSYVATRQVVLPSFPLGDQFLLLQTNPQQTQREVDFSNNVAARPIRLRAPDLVISDVQVPADAFSGHSFIATWTVTNVGDAAAAGWHDGVHLSSDSVAGGDLFLDSFAFAESLAPGQSVVRQLAVKTPIELKGDFFLVVTADRRGDVIEGNETNNSRIAEDAFTLRQPPIPNLQVTQVTTTAAERQLFQEFQVDWVVTNTGTGATNVSFWKDAVYLSADQTLDGTDIKLAEIGNPAYLNDNEAYSNRAIVRAHSVSAGNYFLLVRTDSRDLVEEHFHEGDNVTVGPQITITLPPPPDLVVSRVAAPEQAFSGQLMSLTWQVTNQGQARAISPWHDAVYMSADNVLDDSDRLLAQFAFEQTYQVAQTTTIHGDYMSCFGEETPDPVTEIIFSSTFSLAAVEALAAARAGESSRTICTLPAGAAVTEQFTYELEIIQAGLHPGESYTRTRSVRLPVGVSGPFSSSS